jgi:hypothetical protein
MLKLFQNFLDASNKASQIEDENIALATIHSMFLGFTLTLLVILAIAI